MTNLILCGNPADISVSTALFPALERYGGFRYTGPGRIFETGPVQKFQLYESEKIPRIGLESGVILFRNHIPEQTPVRIPPGFLCVMESKNRRAAALVKVSGNVAVTCGTSPKDTLSVAALGESSAAISLQRTLTALNGKTLEPHDFSVKFAEPRSPHQLLTVCAALLIAGVDSRDGYVV